MNTEIKTKVGNVLNKLVEILVDESLDAYVTEDWYGNVEKEGCSFLELTGKVEDMYKPFTEETKNLHFSIANMYNNIMYSHKRMSNLLQYYLNEYKESTMRDYEYLFIMMLLNKLNKMYALGLTA